MKKNSISRREAIKRFGTAAVGSSLLPQLLAERLTNNFAAPEATGSQPLSKPNIVWITGEGVPTSVLSCYGSTLMKTPNIDRIAEQGMRFENSFTTNALCAPSRATLLTGKYSHLNGMVSNPEGLIGGWTPPHFDPAQETFPKILKRAGYQTGTVGKWHLPVNPGEVGFDYFVYKNGAGGPYYDPNGYLQNPSLGSTVIEKKSYAGYETDNITDLAMKGIQQFQQPFMMMVQYFNDHRPFDPPHRYEHEYDNIRIPEPGTFWDNYSMRAAPAKEARLRIENMPDFRPPDDLTGRQRKQWNYQKFMGHFLATMHAQDENIGRLLDYLDESGLSKNTIVVYTSDHGFFLGDHGWFDKRFMYEQSIRVPWIVRYPNHIKPGSVTGEWGINIDNAPTILDLIGLPVPAAMQGRSLVPILRGESPSHWQQPLYYHYYEFGRPCWVAPHYGIRTERYKLINYYTINEWELFDLEKDPDEMESLFEWSGYKIHPGYELVVHDLVTQLQQQRERYRDTTGVPVKLWPTSTLN